MKAQHKIDPVDADAEIAAIMAKADRYEHAMQEQYGHLRMYAGLYKWEVGSIEELVAGGESELKALADAGNSIASEWLARIQSAPEAMTKLSLFGEMRVALLQDIRREAAAVKETMWPE